MATATGFTRGTLEEIFQRDGNGALRGLRDDAFEQFEAMPMPSPETEEWRYTDLREFDLSQFTPFAEEPMAETLDDVKPDLLEAAGQVGDRSGLAIQHNSTVVTSHLDPAEAAKGVIFTSLDEAAQDHGDLLENRLHAIVPTGRTKFTAMHGAFRTGGTFVHVPAGIKVE
ncbi:MAG TPA: Fe-S cluster assembly protein SufD, partial [Actinomycetota bacterium]|nr:Fe-S cluster assembly protein SufD [Actinomycetota bacterium]